MEKSEDSTKVSLLGVNVCAEQLISFSQAAKILPSSRFGSPVSPSCVWRWFRYGVILKNKQIVRLEAIRVAGRHLTSVEAVCRFIAAQQSDSLPADERADVKCARNATRRRRDSEDALRKLTQCRPAPESSVGDAHGN